MFKHKASWLLLSASLAISLLYPAAALAVAKSSSSGSNNSGAGSLATAVTQSYNADSSVQVDMIVELKPKDPSTVMPLPLADIKSMLGIVVPQNNAAIVLTPQTVTHQQVLVATSGRYDLLVSNQNGPIKVGDYLTISALAGIGMKANEVSTEVVGKAAGNFSGTANVIGTVGLKDTLGRTSQVSLGRIPVDIIIQNNPLFQKSYDYVPTFLSKAAVTISSKPVPAAKIYLAMALLGLTALITGNMLYSGVRSGMIAVGRNPLSKKSIMRSLVETVIAGLIIFVAGVFAIYLLLKL